MECFQRRQCGEAVRRQDGDSGIGEVETGQRGQPGEQAGVEAAEIVAGQQEIRQRSQSGEQVRSEAAELVFEQVEVFQCRQAGKEVGRQRGQGVPGQIEDNKGRQPGEGVCVEAAEVVAVQVKVLQRGQPRETVGLQGGEGVVGQVEGDQRRQPGEQGGRQRADAVAPQVEEFQGRQPGEVAGFQCRDVLAVQEEVLDFRQVFRCHGTASAHRSLIDDLVAHLRGAAADIPDRSPVRRRQVAERDGGILRQVADRVGPRGVGGRHRLARRHRRGQGEHRLAGVHRNRGDAARLAADGNRKVPGCRLRITVEPLDVRQGQLLALDLRFGEGRSDAVDFVTGLIGAPPVRQIRVDGGAVLEEEDAAVVELEAVGVDGGAVIVLVGGLHRVLEQELGRGRAALVAGLAHGGAEGQVDLGRAGDRHRFAEGRGHADHVVLLVGVVLSRGRG